MKLIFMGKYTGPDQLPKGELPDNAIRFKEPETPEKLNMMAFLFSLPPAVVIAGVIILTLSLHDSFMLTFNILGILLALLTTVLHELLHAINFPKHVEVQMYYSLKHLMLFVMSTAPVSKRRFIWMSFCPNLLLGWIPFAVWAIFPNVPVLSELLLPFSVCNIMFGAGDYMNMYNAWRQMPKGAVTQLSGFNSYWYMP